MKFSKVSQYVLVSTLGLLAASLLSGCLIVTVDYVFVANSASASSGTTGEIQTYAADAESGALRPVDTPVYSGGSSPVAMAVTGDYANLYVANQGNDSVVHFVVNNNGSLTQKDSVSLSFTPTALAVNTAGSNASGTFLYVVGQIRQQRRKRPSLPFTRCLRAPSAPWPLPPLLPCLPTPLTTCAPRA